MRSKVLLLLLTTLFLLINLDHTTNFAHAQSLKQIQKKDNKNVDCVDLADFHYEIIMSLATFPQKGICNEREQAEISVLLENSINSILRSIPGTIETNNKVCSNPVNRRLSLATLPKNTNKTWHDETMTGSLREMNQKQKGRILRHRRHELFIYVGGGRCRYCFFDNVDERALSLASRQGRDTRNLMFLPFPASRKHSYPKVADISLCHRLSTRGFHFMHKQFQKLIKWTNRKNTTFVDKTRGATQEGVVGPYVPGESFGAQLDTSRAVRSIRTDAEIHRVFQMAYGEDYIMVKQPVKEGTVSFWVWAFDLPTDSTTEMLADDPFYVFINGLKLDFSLLMAQSGVKRTQTDREEVMSGSSFAGIKWKISRFIKDGNNFAFGPGPDRRYRFQITVPLIVLLHKNQLDIDFIIKPKAKAKRYMFQHLTVSLKSAACDVTGIENSRFEDFQSVVESRLFHKLGMDLAHEFQGQEGHCLYDKIPVVEVHLVEKENWKESNPQCAD